MNDDTERTDIIPGLRPSDTRPQGLPALQGRHRARRGAPTPRWALVTVFGAPVAVLAVTVGLVLPGWLTDPSPEAAPPRASGAPTSVEPPPRLPTPTPSRADRSRPRTTTPTPSPTASPSPSRTSSSPSPEPEPTATHRSPSPLRTEPTGTTPPSPTPTSPTATPTLTILPEATDGQ